MAEKPPILFIGSQMATGEAQRILLDHAEWFYQQGYPVTVAFFYDQTGLLLPTADSEAISRAILRLLAEPEFRVNLSAQGKTLVEEKFNRDQMCTRYRNLFENLLEGSK